MNLPEMTEVKSSNVHSVGHDGAALFVRFKTKAGPAGVAYRYPGVPAEVRDTIALDESPGRAFNAFSRSDPSIKGEKVEIDEPADAERVDAEPQPEEPRDE